MRTANIDLRRVGNRTDNDADSAMDAQRAYAAALALRQIYAARTVVGALSEARRMLRRRVLTPVETWCRRDRLRHELVMLDDRRLAEIGVRREEIGRVVKKAYAGQVAA